MDLRTELLSTGDAILVEVSHFIPFPRLSVSDILAPFQASEQDAFWGCGLDGKGRNELGKALMKLRDELRALS